jgi:hypothetical protein
MSQIKQRPLIKQPTAKPTRKWVAMIIAGMVVGGVSTALDIFWPGHPFQPLMDDLGMYVQLAVIGFVGYMTRNRQA